MQVEQYVMAYQVEQDRLRAMLPEGYESLRGVLRINAERRTHADGRESYALEFNTPVSGFGRRGWLNIAHWVFPGIPIQVTEEEGNTVFATPFLAISFTPTGAVGGCPAEPDNEGCFYRDGFRPAEVITAPREFCRCAFRWCFTAADGRGIFKGDRTLPAAPSAPPRTSYAPRPLMATVAAAIPCEQVLGAYRVRFERDGD